MQCLSRMRTLFTKSATWLTAAMILCGSLIKPAFVHAHSAAKSFDDHAHDSVEHDHHHDSMTDHPQAHGSFEAGILPTTHCHLSLFGIDISLPVNGSDSPVHDIGENADALLGFGRVTSDISLGDLSEATLSSLVAALTSVRRFEMSPNATYGAFAICDCLRKSPSTSARLAQFGLLLV